ncbi:hypothetical protein J5N97_025617 [Dioscorea zingiberensis]|uniref:Cytochrome P450 n=1 Tax=Dioscorea zingiberensis TaxID=325984 RepID=A0A9D5C1Q1_9LILI|nr:hypothetical protein J5N97_025617 [Dioscorea zingiberensis]
MYRFWPSSERNTTSSTSGAEENIIVLDVPFHPFSDSALDSLSSIMSGLIWSRLHMVCRRVVLREIAYALLEAVPQLLNSSAAFVLVIGAAMFRTNVMPRVIPPITLANSEELSSEESVVVQESFDIAPQNVVAREASDHLSRSGVKSLHTEERYAIIRAGWPSSFLHVLGKHSISVEVGDAHKARMRSIVVNFLSNERLRTVFLQHSNRVASLLLSSLEENSIISAKDVSLKFPFYVMVKEIFSMSPEEPENDKLMREYDTLVRGIASIPWNLPGSQYQQALESRKEIFKVFEQRMKERRGEKKGDDLLGWVMKNTEYSKEQMFDFILHTLFAGHDTTSRAIFLMIYFLEGCPQAIQQLREEHLQVSRLKNQKGKSSLTWDDYKTMEFTKCVINETLRLGNIAGFVQKKAKMDVQYGGLITSWHLVEVQDYVQGQSFLQKVGDGSVYSPSDTELQLGVG